jgi:hypothetical protein
MHDYVLCHRLHDLIDSVLNWELLLTFLIRKTVLVIPYKRTIRQDEIRFLFAARTAFPRLNIELAQRHHIHAAVILIARGHQRLRRARYG